MLVAIHSLSPFPAPSHAFSALLYPLLCLKDDLYTPYHPDSQAGWFPFASGQCKALGRGRKKGEESSWSFFFAFSLLKCPGSGTLWQQIRPSSFCSMVPPPRCQLSLRPSNIILPLVLWTSVP